MKPKKFSECLKKSKVCTPTHSYGWFNKSFEFYKELVFKRSFETLNKSILTNKRSIPANIR
jgi:hypothetical protein